MSIQRPICGLVASACVCSGQPDHDGSHICDCGGSWHHDASGEFVIDTLPGASGVVLLTINAQPESREAA